MKRYPRPSQITNSNVGDFKWHRDWVLSPNLRLTHHRTGLQLMAVPSTSPSANDTLLANEPSYRAWSIARVPGTCCKAIDSNKGLFQRLVHEADELAAYHFAGMCQVCHVDTLESASDYYMLKNRIWRSVCISPRGMMCLSCVESRLGRKLVREDFTGAPINYMSPKLKTLQPFAGGLED